MDGFATRCNGMIDNGCEHLSTAWPGVFQSHARNRNSLETKRIGLWEWRL